MLCSTSKDPARAILYQFGSQRPAGGQKPTKKMLGKEIKIYEDYGHTVLPQSQLSGCFTVKKNKKNFICLRQCEDARLLGSLKPVFLWELNFKVFQLNKQVDKAAIKDLVASGGVHE